MKKTEFKFAKAILLLLAIGIIPNVFAGNTTLIGIKAGPNIAWSNPGNNGIAAGDALSVQPAFGPSLGLVWRHSIGDAVALESGLDVSYVGYQYAFQPLKTGGAYHYRLLELPMSIAFQSPIKNELLANYHFGLSGRFTNQGNCTSEMDLGNPTSLYFENKSTSQISLGLSAGLSVEKLLPNGHYLSLGATSHFGTKPLLNSNFNYNIADVNHSINYRSYGNYVSIDIKYLMNAFKE